ncbi:alpha/beta hydrolase [uncultured Thiocystis sp.]|jgi:esterase/lipase superfamily enzyme|uniref:alpha/beta hydrolase n=1 Tax=uncultured Thiocystis sp. TaxID=1202134 RepID=UPI0025D9A50E|nr:alpha/beta hydrolase [uncultured Thiocystis sp.]
MPRRFIDIAAILLTVVLLGGCAASGRPLMPTPLLYQLPGGQTVFDPSSQGRLNPDVDLLFITDRAPETVPESTQPYGQERARQIRFGTAQVRLVPALDWETLRAQSQLAERTQTIDLELGPVRELGAFPEEPYRLRREASGKILRDRAELARHTELKATLQNEVARRLAVAPRKELLLYVHGFNETFATSAFTTAELCHFLGREHVCAFFTWPASTTGNFLTSYTTTTESADYAVEHLKKAIRMLAATPGLERLQILAHSRGTALTLKAVRELTLEAIAAGKEPVDLYRIGNLVLLSPDIDVDIAGQQLTGFLSDPDLVTLWPEGRLPRVLQGRLTIYTSADDRALLVSRILFRSRHRVGQLRPEDISERAQRYFATLDRVDLISYEGKRTDLFGHSYFTTNPAVSSDLIQMVRYGKRLGEPGRQLVKTGPVTWRFPADVEEMNKSALPR